MRTTDLPIVVEAVYKANIEAVWKALTEPEQMRQWYFNQLLDFKTEVEFETQFALQHEGRTFTHMWKVTEVIPNETISYTWRYEEYPGNSIVSFRLKKTDAGTHLLFKTIVLEDFPKDIPAFTKASCIAGWTYLIAESLQKYMEGL